MDCEECRNKNKLICKLCLVDKVYDACVRNETLDQFTMRKANRFDIFVKEIRAETIEDKGGYLL